MLVGVASAKGKSPSKEVSADPLKCPIHGVQYSEQDRNQDLKLLFIIRNCLLAVSKYLFIDFGKILTL